MDNQNLILFNMVRRILDQLEQHDLATEKNVNIYAADTFLLLDLIAQQVIANDIIETFDGATGFEMDARTLDGKRLRFTVSLEASDPATDESSHVGRRVNDLQTLNTDEIRARLRAENLPDDLINNLLDLLGRQDDDPEAT